MEIIVTWFSTSSRLANHCSLRLALYSTRARRPAALEQLAAVVAGDGRDVRGRDGGQHRQAAVDDDLEPRARALGAPLEVWRHDDAEAHAAGVEPVDELAVAGRMRRHPEVRGSEARDELAARGAARQVDHGDRVVVHLRGHAVAARVDGARERPHEDEQHRHVPEELAELLAREGGDPAAHQPTRLRRMRHASE
jgi:hypothetical protein